MEPTTTSKHTGSCHCGAVRFEVEVDASKGSRCNCRVCTKLGATTSIVKPAAFTLLSDESATFGYGNEYGKREFCKTCGIFCFGRGHLEQVGGDYVSVNLNCIDGIDPSEMSLVYWDGRHDNWAAGPRPTPWPVNAPA
jgi:hypothetical protein